MKTPEIEHLDKFEITIDPRAILHIQGYRAGHEPKPAIMTLINRAIEEALQLAKPKGIYGEFPVAELKEDSLVIEDGTCFSIGPRISSWWKGSKAVVTAVCTIGGDLEKRLAELSAKGEHTAGLNLDIAGSVALGSLGDQVHQYICRKASDKGVEMGPFVNPGYREWPLTDQKLIFNMMPAASIGVTLNEHCMMVPKKSVTFCSGAGVSEVQENFNRCKHCGLAKCPYRRVSKKDDDGFSGLHGPS
jgi:hypothetical protein